MDDIHNDRFAWLIHGIRRRWVKEYCDTHDITRTEQEMDDSEKTDVCIPVLRFAFDDEQYEQFPDNHEGGMGL